MYLEGWGGVRRVEDAGEGSGLSKMAFPLLFQVSLLNTSDKEHMP